MVIKPTVSLVSSVLLRTPISCSAMRKVHFWLWCQTILSNKNTIILLVWLVGAQVHCSMKRLQLPSLQFWSSMRRNCSCPTSWNLSNGAKSRSWTFPARLSPTVCAAPLAFAGCQHWFLAFACLTFLRTAGAEAASPREEDCGAEEEDTADVKEAGAAASGAPSCTVAVRRNAADARCSFLEV